MPSKRAVRVLVVRETTAVDLPLVVVAVVKNYKSLRTAARAASQKAKMTGRAKDHAAAERAHNAAREASHNDRQRDYHYNQADIHAEAQF